MKQVDALFALTNCFCLAVNISEATLSTRIFSDGKRIASIRGGADIGTRRLDRALQWFSDHWPADVAWPHDVPRPAVSLPEAAE